MNDKIMDNQQETLKETELAWFAGFFDGEGCLTMISTFNSKKERFRRLNPLFTITNTDDNSILETVKICEKIGAPLRIRRMVSNKVKKPYYICDVNALSKVKKLLDTLLPYLITKKSRAELMLRFINSRLKRWREFKENDGFNEMKLGKDVPYNNEEISVAEEIRRLNNRGSSETIRKALLKEREDIVQLI
jgi:hypothetical protein